MAAIRQRILRASIVAPLACLLGSSSTALCEPSGVTIVQGAKFSGDVSSALIMSYSPKTGIAVAPAVAIRSSVQEETLLVGRIALEQDASDVTLLMGASAKTGEVVSTVRNYTSVADDPITLLTTATLENSLQERRRVLKGWEDQSREQTGNLERLQEDADVIANVGRIVDAEDELGVIQADVERLTASLKLAQERLGLLKDSEVPPTAARKEAELSSELNLISAAVKNTEASSLQKITAASSELQQKLALIDATKNEHMDLLERELQTVRRERMELESAPKPQAGTLPE